MDDELGFIVNNFFSKYGFLIDSGNIELYVDHYYSYKLNIFCTIDFKYKCLYFYKNYYRDKHIELKFQDISNVVDLNNFFVKSIRHIKLQQLYECI